MCLAIPGEILSITSDDVMRRARVSFDGVTREVMLVYVPEANVGDYVLVHAGFAIARVSEAHAKEAIAAIARPM